METKDNNYDITDMINELVMVARDCNLPFSVQQKYYKGMILREIDYTDATYLLGGMETTHRFTIMSNQFKDLSSLNIYQKGLCMADRNSRYKVLDIYNSQGKTQILLLHLPSDERWKNFLDVTYITEYHLATFARKNFDILSCQKQASGDDYQELLKKFEKPLGFDKDGNLIDIIYENVN